MSAAVPMESFLEDQERFTRALLGRLANGSSVTSQGALLQAGVQATLELLELRRLGFAVSEATVVFALEQLAEAVGRLLELVDQESSKS